MKITCRGCHDTFEVPDGKGITSAICPFCDKPNDLRAPPTSASSSQYPAPAHLPNADPILPKAPAHPLAPQFWILAICALIVTAIICISFLFTVASVLETGKANQKVAEEINKVSEEFSHSMDKTTKELQKSLKKLAAP